MSRCAECGGITPAWPDDQLLCEQHYGAKHWRPRLPTALELHEAMQNAPHDNEPYRHARAALALFTKLRDR